MFMYSVKTRDFLSLNPELRWFGHYGDIPCLNSYKKYTRHRIVVGMHRSNEYCNINDYSLQLIERSSNIVNKLPATDSNRSHSA